MERNQEGDREKASNLLNQALEIFQKMNAKKEIEKVEAILTNLEKGRVVTWETKTVSLVATGYAVLDKLLYGGIYPNFAVALTSPSCEERDSLIKSFLETGAKKGEPTFYLTIDPSLAGFLAEEFPSNFYLFVCNPQAEAIIKSSPNLSILKGIENLTNIGIALTSAIRKLDPSLKGLKENMHITHLRRAATAWSRSNQKVADRTSHTTKISRLHNSCHNRPADASFRATSRNPRAIRRRSQHPRSRNRQRTNKIPQSQKDEQPEIHERRTLLTEE